MEKLWTPQELMARHGWENEKYAIRKIHAEMRHIGKGKKTRVPESALREWEEKQTREAGNDIRKAASKKRTKGPSLKVVSGGGTGKHIVPRSREEALRQLGYG